VCFGIGLRQGILLNLRCYYDILLYKGKVHIGLRDDAYTQQPNNDPSKSPLQLQKSVDPAKKVNLANIYSGRLHPATARRSPQVHGTVSTGNGIMAHFVCYMSQ
jgi:hypothetical protein